MTIHWEYWTSDRACIHEEVWLSIRLAQLHVPPHSEREIVNIASLASFSLFRAIEVLLLTELQERHRFHSRALWPTALGHLGSYLVEASHQGLGLLHDTALHPPLHHPLNVLLFVLLSHLRVGASRLQLSLCYLARKREGRYAYQSACLPRRHFWLGRQHKKALSFPWKLPGEFLLWEPHFLNILEELQSQHHGRVFDASEPQLEQQIAAVTGQALPRAPNERKKSGSR